MGRDAMVKEIVSNGGFSMDTIIRKWHRDDAEELAKVLSNKNIHDNLRDGLPFPYTKKDAQAFIESMLRADSSSTFAFAIVDGDRVIGSIGVFRSENIHRRTAEIGYYLSENDWGKGFATRAVTAVTAYIFKETDILRIFAEPFSTNKASCRLLEKCGFQFEGTLRKNAVKNGEVKDMHMYALIK